MILPQHAGFKSRVGSGSDLPLDFRRFSRRYLPLTSLFSQLVDSLRSVFFPRSFDPPPTLWCDPDHGVTLTLLHHHRLTCGFFLLGLRDPLSLLSSLLAETHMKATEAEGGDVMTLCERDPGWLRDSSFINSLTPDEIGCRPVSVPLWAS